MPLLFRTAQTKVNAILTAVDEFTNMVTRERIILQVFKYCICTYAHRRWHISEL